MGVYLRGVTKRQLWKVIINSTEFLPDYCEIVEVETPHGRLIDEDDFIAGMEEAYCEECKANKKDYNGVKCRACWVDDTKTSTDLANTVIEAEVE